MWSEEHSHYQQAHVSHAARLRVLTKVKAPPRCSGESLRQRDGFLTPFTFMLPDFGHRAITRNKSGSLM